MACHLFSAKPLFEPILPYCQLDPREHISVKFYRKFSFKKMHLKMSSEMVAILSWPECVKMNSAWQGLNSLMSLSITATWSQNHTLTHWPLGDL